MRSTPVRVDAGASRPSTYGIVNQGRPSASPAVNTGTMWGCCSWAARRISRRKPLDRDPGQELWREHLDHDLAIERFLAHQIGGGTCPHHRARARTYMGPPERSLCLARRASIPACSIGSGIDGKMRAGRETARKEGNGELGTGKWEVGWGTGDGDGGAAMISSRGRPRPRCPVRRAALGRLVERSRDGEWSTRKAAFNQCPAATG